jgi:hypothetical protein
MRRVGLLMGYPEGDAEGQANLAAFRRGLQELGWIEGRNIRIDTRWGGADPAKARTFAKELVDMKPDVIVPNTNLMTAILQPETRTIPSLSQLLAVLTRNGESRCVVLQRRLSGEEPAGAGSVQPRQGSRPGRCIQCGETLARGLVAHRYDRRRDVPATARRAAGCGHTDNARP